ncbi:hypothetical protein [Bradyrhizobium sp. CCBAU 051011]|uniref:hypothetical protein n=1 Tax=Bradyrhizobium sp. CCBAU 051011 TaxID=858422 RepID=UPI00137B51BB|nr:hypothetical protein [Bradyrhizobium sp. CCBAU 051011]
MDNDEVKALAEIQGQLIDMRRMAAETTDLRKRDACLRVADAFEKRTRELDQSEISDIS